MLKKFLSLSLAVTIFTVASNTGVFAQTNSLTEIQTIAQQEKQDTARDLRALLKTANNSADAIISHKSTLAEYQRAKQQGKKFSTTTKVLIGVGIAAAVIGVVVFAASRDKIKTF